MGRRFLLAFFTLSALFLMIHARADGSSANSEPDPLRVMTRSRARTLLRSPETEKSTAVPPLVKEPTFSAEQADGDDGKRESAPEAPTESESRKMETPHSADKSMAGGGVIIGGLVAAIFAAVYSYIRVTRRRPRPAESFA